MRTLASDQWDLLWSGPWRVSASKSPHPVVTLALMADGSAFTGGDPPDVIFSRSGLVYCPSAVCPPFTHSVCARIASVYLEGFDMVAFHSDALSFIFGGEVQAAGLYPSPLAIVATMVGVLAGASMCVDLSLHPPPWAPLLSPSHIKVVTSDSLVSPPMEDLLVYIQSDGFLFPTGQSSIRMGSRWHVSWDGCLESGTLASLESALLAL